MIHTTVLHTLSRISAVLLMTMLFTACDRDFKRDSDKLVIFDTHDYPVLSGSIVTSEEMSTQKLVLAYKYGGNKHVIISADEQAGIYIEEQEVTLSADEGQVELPLKGKAGESGLITLKVRISYDSYHIFCSKEIGIRPAGLAGVEMLTEPALAGYLYQGLPADNCTVSFDYSDGWGRTATVWFTCDDTGIDQTPRVFTLAPDDQAATLEVPVPGIPENTGRIDLTMHLHLEGSDEIAYLFSDIDVLQAISYEEQTVSHNIIITDRNQLISGSEVLIYSEFTYKTVFIDLNNDGYVSSNAEIWLDRNVGATSTDTSSEDAYGFIYQPGRAAPGWVSGSQTGGVYPGEPYALNNATWYNGTDKPVTVNTLDDKGSVTGVITIDPQAAGPNNPCPEGFRLPLKSEWEAVYRYFNCTPASHSALKDGVLKLPFAGGYLANANTERKDTGEKGYYWCAPYDNNQVPAITFANDPAVANRAKGFGLPVRCVKAE